jgi:molecular chaperone GrpE
MEDTRIPHREDSPCENPSPELHLPVSKGHKIPVSVVDRRRVGQTEGAEASEPDTKPLYVQQLEERVRRVEAAYKHQVAELQEEARKSRERLLRDLEMRYAEKERALLLEVLGLLDDVGRACALSTSVPQVAEGLELIASRAGQFLKSHGCRALDPTGQPFDPATMEAVGLLEGPEGQVVGVLQPGYLLGEALLRPARVMVGRGAAASPPPDTNQT